MSLRLLRFAAAALVAVVALNACTDADPPVGPADLSRGDDHGFAHAAANASVPPGYFLQPLATGLDFPTAIASSAEGIWVAEAGVVPGFPPTVKRIDPDGGATMILSGDQLGSRLMGPLTDVTFHDGWLWITHRQTGVNGWAVGAISKFRPDDPMGTFTTVLTNLPSAGDHYTEEIVFGPDGRAYFSQGSATNSSVVGADNFLITGWLGTTPRFHDFPAKSVVLNGRSYQTAVPFPLDPEADDITAPFMPFGSGPVAPGTVVPGAPRDGIIAGNGAIYSFDPAGAAALRLEGWGFRNPYGIGLDPMNPGVLYATDNGADTRGVAGETSVPVDEEDIQIVESRPIDEDFDDLFQLQVGGEEEFFGWPDFFHDPESGAVLPVIDEEFCEELEECPEFVLDAGFRSTLQVQPAVGELGYHTSANKFDFSTSQQFRHEGDLFVAQTGSFVPVTGATEFTGYKVVRVDRSGHASDFIVNTGTTAATIFDPHGFNKPIDVKFHRDAMLIVDFGVFEPGLNLQQPGTGKLWVVCHGAAACKKLAA
jgi:hypothetical protein